MAFREIPFAVGARREKPVGELKIESDKQHTRNFLRNVDDHYITFWCCFCCPGTWIEIRAGLKAQRPPFFLPFIFSSGGTLLVSGVHLFYFRPNYRPINPGSWDFCLQLLFLFTSLCVVMNCSAIPGLLLKKKKKREILRPEKACPMPGKSLICLSSAHMQRERNKRRRW